MPARKVEEEVLLNGLTRIFQDHGFEGASLSRISDATGLEKASLYHRFRGGKEEMAQAVLQRAGRKFADDVLKPLFEDGPLEARVKEAGKRVAAFYENGQRSCLLDTLSFSDGGEKVRSTARTAYEGWRDAFAHAARESGWTPAASSKRAQHAIIVLEGSLVISRVTGDAKPFQDAIRSLPEMLLKPLPAGDEA